MPTTITFFPVDNGDMTLIKFGDLDATTLLIDVNIRQDADNPDGEDVRDVAKDLRERLKKDENGRPYVDAFLLSHPDQDHCRGLTRHFHLGPLDKYPDDKKDDKDKKDRDPRDVVVPDRVSTRQQDAHLERRRQGIQHGGASARTTEP
jgi:hypothetical protein